MNVFVLYNISYSNFVFHTTVPSRDSLNREVNSQVVMSPDISISAALTHPAVLTDKERNKKKKRKHCI